MRRIYMDANATTPVLPEVLEAMRPFWMEAFGNASSIHQPGQQARAAVERARESVSGLLGCRPAEVVFTSGGTESDNLALFGVMEGALLPGEHLIVSSVEHAAVLHAAQALAKRGVEVTFLPSTTQGVVEVSALEAALRSNTRLVSVMLANNETGVIQPIRELADRAHAAGALFHTDAVQAAGKLALDIKALGCDMLSISGHKMYAPQGVGALFVRRNVRLRSIFFGGNHERGRRPGTENVAGIVGLGNAAELARDWLAQGEQQSLAALRDHLEQGILAQVEEAGVNGADVARVSNTSNLFFDHLEAEALVIALDLKGLAVSGGSACQSGATEPSHVLMAMGLSPARARASVRFSLSRLTTRDEIDCALALVPAAVERLRKLAPLKLKQSLALSH
ncbi:MAG TPA: cysteine desulfurase family protein [Acidobacteriaceae bacterium]|jgi:cysteine desulfurase|nr:cysteine desulfurase family protein [Acidobacteriaceae bacterium]